jgi:hypothetical protein
MLRFRDRYESNAVVVTVPSDISDLGLEQVARRVFPDLARANIATRGA